MRVFVHECVRMCARVRAIVRARECVRVCDFIVYAYSHKRKQ